MTMQTHKLKITDSGCFLYKYKKISFQEGENAEEARVGPCGASSLHWVCYY